MFRALVLAAAVFLVPPVASGVLVPIDDPFQVNMDTTGNQDNPRVVPLSDGGFMILWFESIAQQRRKVVGKRFDSRGRPAAEQVEIPPGVDGYGLSVAIQNDRLVLPYERRVASSDFEFGVGTFDLDGTPTSFFAADGDTRDPSVAVTPLGETVLTWAPFFEPIRLQRFRPDGSIAGPSFVVDDTRIDDDDPFYPHSPLVGSEPDGSIVVVWYDEGPYILFGQRFDSDDRSIGEHFIIADDSDIPHGGIVYDLCVDQRSGDFTVAWADASPPYTHLGRFSAEPRMLGRTSCGALSGYPSVACASGDRFLITGLAGDSAGPLIAVRAFDRDFHVLGSAFIPVPSYRRPVFTVTRAAMLANGDAVVVWTQCADPPNGKLDPDCDVFGQRIAVSFEEGCAGDCDHDGMVSVDELITAIDLAVDGVVPVDRCPSLDIQADCRVSIDEIVAAVDHSLNGCH